MIHVWFWTQVYSCNKILQTHALVNTVGANPINGFEGREFVKLDETKKLLRNKEVYLNFVFKTCNKFANILRAFTSCSKMFLASARRNSNSAE